MGQNWDMEPQPYQDGDYPGGSKPLAAVIREIPPFTATVVIINIVVFILCTFKGDVLYNKGAVGLPYLTTLSGHYRIITSMFLHADVSHLFNNMLLLFFAGEIVERAMRTGNFAVMYFISGICGALMTFAHDIFVGDYTIMIGASGAVFGILGSLLALVMFKRIRGATFKAPRIILVLALTVFSGFRQTGIANYAHVGGLFGGLIYGIIYCIIVRQKGNRI